MTELVIDSASKIGLWLPKSLTYDAHVPIVGQLRRLMDTLSSLCDDCAILVLFLKFQSAQCSRLHVACILKCH